MGFFNDMAIAMDNYPTDEVVMSIVDISLHSGTAGVLNVSETWKCKLQVENTGHINMTGVSVHVNGLNGTTVSLSPAVNFSSIATPGSMTVNGGGSQKSAYIYFLTPSVAKPAGTKLLELHFGGWTGGNFDHMFSNHTLEDLEDPRASYAAQVHP